MWLLALVLFGCLAAVGYNQGVIRVGFSFFGLIIGALLAVPLGRFLHPVLGVFGVKNPVMLWLWGPFVVFIIVQIAFKIAAYFVHEKVEVYYKYKVGDIHQGLWNRIRRRLGLCLGLANAAVYLILISLIVYVLSYPTVQMADSSNSPTSIRLLNQMGRDTHSSGLAKVAAAIDPMPEKYYEASDVIGLIYHNDLLEGRLARYPAFLSLAEKPEFQAIATDTQFTEMRQRQAPMVEILNYPKAQAILDNPDLLRQIWAIAAPNLKDLQNYLRTGLSPKFDDEKILGRWNFNLINAAILFRKTKPNTTATELQQLKRTIALTMPKATLVATPEKEAYLKDAGQLRPPPPNSPKGTPPTVELQSYKGQWESEGGGKYKLTFPGKDNLTAEVIGDRLMITGESPPLAFDREF